MEKNVYKSRMSMLIEKALQRWPHLRMYLAPLLGPHGAVVQWLVWWRFPIFGRGEQLPFQNETFDAVLLIEVIEHIVPDRETIMEIKRVLRRGGVLVLTTPNGDTFPRPTKHHVRHYTPEGLRRLIEEKLAIEGFWCMFPQGKMWLESVASVRRIIETRNIFALLRYMEALALYWPKTLAWFFTGNTEGTTTLLLVARKS